MEPTAAIYTVRDNFYCKDGNGSFLRNFRDHLQDWKVS